MYVHIQDDIEKCQWFRTGSPELHSQLFNELVEYLIPAPKQRKLSPQLSLELLFFILSTGFSFELVAKVFHVNGNPITPKTAKRTFDRTLQSLQRWVDEQIYLLENDQWLNESQKVMNDDQFQEYQDMLMYTVDGTLISTADSSDIAFHHALYNTKHACPGYVFFIIVTLSGRIVYVSNIERGNIHDKTHFKLSNVCDLLQTKYGNVGHCTINGKQYFYVLLGDKAYPHAPKPPDWSWRVTKSAKQTVDIDDQGQLIGQPAGKDPPPNVHFDPKIAILRSVVERTIRRVKMWPIFHALTTHMASSNTISLVVQLTCALSNWMKREGVIRQI